MEYLDPWTSRAFAVADHQIAHVYVADPADLAARARRSPELDGVGEVLEGESLAAAGLEHERSGELVALAERDAWFTYHYWLDNEHAPDFGRQVEIHRKPGYDPAELFFDPDDEKGAKLRGGMALARKMPGMRYVLSVVGLDASKYVKGTHGLLPEADEDARCSCPARPSPATASRTTCATSCWTSGVPRARRGCVTARVEAASPASPSTRPAGLPPRAGGVPPAVGAPAGADERYAAQVPRAVARRAGAGGVRRARTVAAAADLRATPRCRSSSLGGEAGLDRAIHGLGREHVLDDHDRGADRAGAVAEP